MAGVFPVPVKTSSRKQWTVYHGGKGIKRLGSPLMDDWSPDSQVRLAKRLLDEKCDLDVDQEENAKLAVYWLVKASEQGHSEATELLSHCLETGQGICEQNYMDVRSCLDMPLDEKLARCAARKAFESIAAGEDFITTDQLQDRMCNLEKLQHQGDQNQPSTSNADWKSRSEGGEKLTEDMLISAASTYSRGELPLVSAVLSVRPHPFSVVTASCNHLVYSLARHSIWWYMPLSLAQLKVALVVVCILSTGMDTLVTVLPTMLYYCALTVMVVATCQVLRHRQDLRHFRRWSSLFLAYSDGSMNAGQAEYQYCRNHLQPYAWYFLGLLAHLFLYPMLQQSIQQSELAVLAYGFTIITLGKFSVMRGDRGPDWLALFSFAVHVLAKYPYDSDTVVSRGWRFLDVHVPTFASYVVGNGVEFCLNFRALFYLVIPAVLVRMAARDGWRGCYVALVPHCVALSWWQIAVTASEGATWYGLIRSTLALAGLVLFLPLAGLTYVLLPLAAASKLLVESLGTSSLLALLPIVLSLYLGRLKTLYSHMSTLLSWLQVVLTIASAVLLMWPVLNSEDETDVPDIPSSVSWDQFQTLCPVAADDGSLTGINANLRCSQLVGSMVSWEGRVSVSRVAKVSNPLVQVISHLPLKVQAGLTCLLGEPLLCDQGQYCSSVSSRCHLANWNRYELEMEVSMYSGAMWSGGSRVRLMADHSFLNFTSALVTGDRVWFAGLLTGGVTGVLTRNSPHISIREIGCLSCNDATLTVERKPHVLPAPTIAGLYSAVKTVLNFLFNPLVIFH